jgi:hypothetical protein
MPLVAQVEGQAMTWIKLHTALVAVLLRLLDLQDHDPSAFGAKGLDL